MRKFYAALVAAAAFGFLAAPAQAQQPTYTKAGMLTCATSASVGLILTAHQRLRCTFAPDDPRHPPEHYAGSITRLGLNLGVTTGGVLSWAVIAPTKGVPHGALTGTYSGASGDVAFGVGVGANALVGGSHRSFALQPFSVSGQVGINLAVGVASMTLHSVR
jgi:hypothetical protein